MFDAKGNTLTLSAASEFMSAAWDTPHTPRGQQAPPTEAHVAIGTLGTVTSVPAGYTLASIAVAGAGPTRGVMAAGSRLQLLHGKNATASREADVTLSSLGATTDNGAYVKQTGNRPVTDR